MGYQSQAFCLLDTELRLLSVEQPDGYSRLLIEHLRELIRITG